MILNINTDAAVIFTNKLERMSKSALPIAVRGALNKAAFNVKQDTLLKHSKADFINRQDNFFKANSKVDMAKGFDLRGMKATIGMVSTGLKGNNYSVENLKEQEKGGTINKKSYIPMDNARSGGRLVGARNRLSSIKKIVNAKNAKGKNDKEKFVKSVIYAGVGGYVLGNFKSKQILWRVNSINKTRGGSFKLTPLYSFKQNRNVKVSATHFMKKASLESGKRIEEYFISEAYRQLAKLK